MEGTTSGTAKSQVDMGTKDGDARIGETVVRGRDEKEEDSQRKEQEMIQKGVAFWNHPALRDVPYSEKRSYLCEQQGLTEAQIHMVWEEIVASPSVGMEGTIQNRSTMAPQHNSGRTPNRNNPHHYNNVYQSASHLPTDSPHRGRSQASLYHGHDSQNNYIGGRQLPFPPTPNDVSMAMEDGSISVARGLSLLGVGGALGVTGAAAVRWLNGGRFELFPTAASTLKSAGTIGGSRTQVTSDEHVPMAQQQTNIKGQATNEESVNKSPDRNGDHDDRNEGGYDNDHEYDDAEYSDNDDEEQYGMEECLLERMDALLSSIDSNSLLQEKLILKLANTSTITDDSMSLLKQNNQSGKKVSSANGTTEENTKTIVQLKDIREKMFFLFNSMTNATSNNDPANETKEDWEEEFSKLLARFDGCIQVMEKPIESVVVDSDAVDNKSTSTSETTQTESQGRQEMKLLPPAPTTPAAGESNETSISSSDMMETLMPLTLSDCIRKMVEKNNTISLRSGSQLLYLYLANLSGKPDNRRYRKIFTSNESFQKVEKLIGGKDLLYAVGFVEESDKGILEWVPSGSTEEEISALILVKEAAAALGVLKKPDNVLSSELVQLALSKLSLSSSSFSVPPPSSPKLGTEIENDMNVSHDCDPDGIPQTPIGSSLLSPPMPKKMPFVPTPSDNLLK